MLKVSFLIPTYNVEQFIETGLNSIPWSENIEVIVRDDGSTDRTVQVLQKYKEDHPNYNFTFVVANHVGAASNYNALMELATGEYIQFMDSDDYFYTDNYKKIMEQMNGEDCIYMDLVINSGDVWKQSPETRVYWCSPCAKAIRREFAKGAKFPENRIADGDWFFNQELLKRNPVSVFTGIPAYHYNFPRFGSLMNLRARGIVKEQD